MCVSCLAGNGLIRGHRAARWAKGEQDSEGGTLPFLAVHRDLATVGVHYVLDDLGAQAGPAWLPADNA